MAKIFSQVGFQIKKLPDKKPLSFFFFVEKQHLKADPIPIIIIIIIKH